MLGHYQAIELKNINVHFGEITLLKAINLTINAGEVVSLVGPNGAGKTTLLNKMAGENLTSTGDVIINGRQYWDIKDKALMVGVMLQSSSLNFPFFVEEVVLLGRIPSSSDRHHNVLIAREALRQVDCLSLKNRLYTTLSGGEKQRVHMARVLVQIWDDCPLGARYLLLDEPTSALDPAHKQQLLEVLRERADKGIGVFIILHDINLAACYSDRIILFKNGTVFAEGAPYEVLTAENLFSVFHIHVKILTHPTQDCPVVIFI